MSRRRSEGRRAGLGRTTLPIHEHPRASSTAYVLRAYQHHVNHVILSPSLTCYDDVEVAGCISRHLELCLQWRRVTSECHRPSVQFVVTAIIKHDTTIIIDAVIVQSCRYKVSSVVSNAIIGVSKTLRMVRGPSTPLGTTVGKLIEGQRLLRNPLSRSEVSFVRIVCTNRITC